MSRRLQVDERRAQLLALGVELFSTRPYDEVSIDDIAGQAGVSKGLLYHYFGGKRAFYIATLELAASALLDAVGPPGQGPTAERAREGLDAYLGFVEARATAFTTLMRGGLGNDPEVEAIIDRTRQAFVDQVLTSLGLDDSRPAWRVAARTWIGAVEAASLDWLQHRDVSREDLVEILTGMLPGLVATAARLDAAPGST